MEQCSLLNVDLWSGREKKKREIGVARKRAENREGSLGFPGFVKPVFTKDSKPLGRREKITRAPRERETRTHLKKYCRGATGEAAAGHLTCVEFWRTPRGLVLEYSITGSGWDRSSPGTAAMPIGRSRLTPASVYHGEAWAKHATGTRKTPLSRYGSYGKHAVFHFEHNFESDGWDWKQLTHFGSRVQSVEGCPTVAPSRTRQLSSAGSLRVSNLWHLKQRRGFGTYGRILQFRYPALTVAGRFGLLKVKIMCFVGITVASFLIVILLT
ncbi:hypothetical protein TNCV_176461 [Trichonephila clavipes]|nr:hypothetical protein TNCV_176461 [Trichonephila clavipes]